MRILQIVSSATTSGTERHVLNLSHLLRRRGHHVEVICPTGWLPGKLREYGIPVIETAMRGKAYFRVVGRVIREIREDKIDVVHAHLTRATYFGSIGGLLTNRPVVATVHIANHDLIYKRMARAKNRLVAVSNYVRGLLHGRGIPDRFIDTVYNGTDFIDWSPTPGDDVRSEFGIDPNRKLIGLVGRVCREKGHMLMIGALRELAAEHPEAHVVFVGRIERHFEPEFREAIASAGLNDRITMTGPRNDVPRLLDAFDFTTMPSKMETFGIAAIEAMARQKPVVASKVGGLPEVVRHQQTGLLVDLRPEALAEAMSYMLNNEADRRDMGAMGRRIVEEKFTLPRMVDGLETVYSSALGR